MNLSEYLNKTGTSAENFASLIGAGSKATVYRYLAGTRRPSEGMMQKIKEATNGQVTPNDFYQ